MCLHEGNVAARFQVLMRLIIQYYGHSHLSEGGIMYVIQYVACELVMVEKKVNSCRTNTCCVVPLPESC